MKLRTLIKLEALLIAQRLDTENKLHHLLFDRIKGGPRTDLTPAEFMTETRLRRAMTEGDEMIVELRTEMERR